MKFSISLAQLQLQDMLAEEKKASPTSLQDGELEKRRAELEKRKHLEKEKVKNLTKWWYTFKILQIFSRARAILGEVFSFEKLTSLRNALACNTIKCKKLRVFHHCVTSSACWDLFQIGNLAFMNLFRIWSKCSFTNPGSVFFFCRWTLLWYGNAAEKQRVFTTGQQARKIEQFWEIYNNFVRHDFLLCNLGKKNRNFIHTLEWAIQVKMSTVLEM